MLRRFLRTVNQMKADKGSLDIYNIPLKKVHVGDIDVAYKIFGKGNNTIILINGGGENMNFWDPHFLKELSTNNSVIVFDSRGIGNTTLGNKPFTISQFANDTAGLLNQGSEICRCPALIMIKDNFRIINVIHK